MKQRSRLLGVALPLLGVSGIVAGTVLMFQNQPALAQNRLDREPVTAPVSSTLRGFVGAIAVSEPPGEALLISTQRAGVVTEVEVTVGAEVAAGAVLFRVERSLAQAALAEAGARVTLAQAELQEVQAQAPIARARLAAAEAALGSARAAAVAEEAALADAQARLGFALAVDDPRAISRQELETRRLAVQRAEAALAVRGAEVATALASVSERRAGLALLVVPAGGEGPQILAARGRLQAVLAERQRAESDLALHEVRAPESCRVLAVNVRVGEYAAPGTPSEGAVVLARLGPPNLRVEIDEVDVARFDTQAPAWASARGENTRVRIEFLGLEPLMARKGTLGGRTAERVDTRVLEALYALPDDYEAIGLGQQFDVYLGATEASK